MLQGSEQVQLMWLTMPGHLMVRSGRRNRRHRNGGVHERHGGRRRTTTCGEMEEDASVER